MSENARNKLNPIPNEDASWRREKDDLVIIEIRQVCEDFEESSKGNDLALEGRDHRAEQKEVASEEKNRGITLKNDVPSEGQLERDTIVPRKTISEANEKLDEALKAVAKLSPVMRHEFKQGAQEKLKALSTENGKAPPPLPEPDSDYDKYPKALKSVVEEVSGKGTMKEEKHRIDLLLDQSSSSKPPDEREEFLEWLFYRIGDEYEKISKDKSKYAIPTLPKPHSDYPIYPGIKKAHYLEWLDRHWGDFLKPRKIKGKIYFRGQTDVLNQSLLSKRDKKLLNAFYSYEEKEFGLKVSEIIPSAQNRPIKTYESLETARWMERHSKSIANAIRRQMEKWKTGRKAGLK